MQLLDVLFVGNLKLIKVPGYEVEWHSILFFHFVNYIYLIIIRAYLLLWRWFCSFVF